MKKDYAKRKNKTETEEWDYKPSVEWAYNPVKISLFKLMDMSSNIKKGPPTFNSKRAYFISIKRSVNSLFDVELP